MEHTEYTIMAAVEAKHWWYRGMRMITAAILDSLYPTRGNLRILDAGCGTGGNALFLQRYGQVVGIDLAPEAIALSPPGMSGNLVRACVSTLPFADAHFDLVTSFDVLYHRAVPDEVVALHEVRRVLRPDGRLLLRLPAYEFLRSKHDLAVHTQRRYTASTARALLTRTGFMVEQCSYVVSFLFPLALVQRLFAPRHSKIEQLSSDMTLPTPLFNNTLRWPLALEAAWLNRGGTFPFGLSVICLARQANSY